MIKYCQKTSCRDLRCNLSPYCRIAVDLPGYFNASPAAAPDDGRGDKRYPARASRLGNDLSSLL